MIRVGIIDDHQLLINGLANVINGQKEMEVVFRTTRPLEILENDILNTIDVLLLDIEMPEIDGIDLTKKVLAIDATLKILILTMYNDQAVASMLKDIGVSGFLSKNTDEHELLAAIENVNRGEKSFSILRRDSSQSEIEHVKIFHQEKLKRLSVREKEILVLIVKGMSNPEIGDELFISPRTVDTHRTNIMKKMQVTNVASLVRIALKAGLVV